MSFLILFLLVQPSARLSYRYPILSYPVMPHPILRDTISENMEGKQEDLFEEIGAQAGR